MLRAEVIFHAAVTLIAALLLAACALPERRAAARTATDVNAPSAAVTEAVHRDLVRGMLEQNQNYAALAHIEALRAQDGDDAQLRWLEAEARRRLGQTQAAEQLYRGLLQGPLAGEAWHGLGLLLAPQDAAQGIAALREAARHLPTDAEVRNDLGYALLRAGRYGEALPELATAVELAPALTRARNNLVVLMMLQGDEDAVSRLAREADLSAQTLATLRREAKTYKQASQAPVQTSGQASGRQPSGAGASSTKRPASGTGEGT